MLSTVLAENCRCILCLSRPVRVDSSPQNAEDKRGGKYENRRKTLRSSTSLSQCSASTIVLAYLCGHRQYLLQDTTADVSSAVTGH